ncbi:hypothetical protein ACLBOM_31040 [Escherichia coli]
MMEVIRDMGVEKTVGSKPAACVLRKMRRNISPSQMNCSVLTGRCASLPLWCFQPAKPVESAGPR